MPFLFFHQLGDYAIEQNSIICLEPNPACYGSNFLLDTNETAQMVALINHPAIKMQFDTGALAINHENVEMIIKNFSPIIGHIHISEPGLKELGHGDVSHQEISNILKKYLPNSLITIEMKATEDVEHLTSIKQAVNFANSVYIENA
ncbi:TIM barrel protein [Acerihabitans sp. KWT182]|uniref:TIM barrel protein n=1 Tax=Acerihabitans sp. KWT182 TaxID=3157919 RepID=A0AAU7Q6B0_9GAMM